MAEKIIFLRKSLCDFSHTNVSVSASQGDDFAGLAIDRNPKTAWATTGSVDSDNTTFTVDFGDMVDLTDILLVDHNFKSYTLKYWNGSAYVDFSSAIAPTTNTDGTTHHSFTQVNTNLIQLTVLGTQTANIDKYMAQIIATTSLGQFNSWAVIENVVHSRNLQKGQLLSGKYNIAAQVGFFSCDLTVKEWKDATDLDLIESLYLNDEGFLVWLSGGNQAQFLNALQGYRTKDLFLMRCGNDYQPNFAEGQYARGIPLSIKLFEIS